jgi:hypothetical protein
VLAELQETPVSRTSPCAPLGRGTLWSVQLEPFQDSASGRGSPGLSSYKPTAAQVLAELQETRARKAHCAPLGKGTLWGVQLEPFQDSASCASPPEMLPKRPTTTQVLAEVQETPSRNSGGPSPGPLAAGTLWGLQLEPSQDSASGPPSPGPISYQPTARQALAEVQETPLSPLDFAPLAAGTLWSVQLEPFQDSASGTSSPGLIS